MDVIDMNIIVYESLLLLMSELLKIILYPMFVPLPIISIIPDLPSFTIILADSGGRRGCSCIVGVKNKLLHG